MGPRQHPGRRIRERRLDLGMRQADLAAAAGISPSYLNLIEHGRRRITGALLTQIAGELGLAPQALTQGAGRDLLNRITAAGSALKDSGAELDKADEMAARYPGWAALIAAQAARLTALEAQVQMVSDRMAYDPALAAALHEVISAVTSIRSTAGILTSDEALDADWQRRFHHNIHDDAERLAKRSEALVGFLEAPQDAVGQPRNPVTEVAAWLAQHDHHLPALEDSEDIAPLLTGATALDPLARAMLARHLHSYAQDAALVPLTSLQEAIRDAGYDPFALARVLGCGPDVVMRRLASLPAGQGHPPIGLVQCDAGGVLLHLKQVAGFTMPQGQACPLWPLFTALGQVGRPVCRDVALPGRPETRLRCVALADQVAASDDLYPPVVRSMMLVMPDPPPQGPDPLPIGVTCRLCPRTDCAARREPSALTQGL